MVSKLPIIFKRIIRTTSTYTHNWPMGVRATSPPRCDYTSRVRFTQTYRDGRGSQEVSIAPSLDSNRLRIGRNGPIIALWAAVQPAKSLILGTSGLIDPLGPRLRPPDLYIIRKLSERRIRLRVPRLYMGMTGMQVLSLDYIWE